MNVESILYIIKSLVITAIDKLNKMSSRRIVMFRIKETIELKVDSKYSEKKYCWIYFAEYIWGFFL